MGKAYYYDSIIPPKDWLIYASLVWDKVWLNPSALLLTESYAPEMLVNSDGAFLYDLMTKTTILDTSIPATDRNLLSQDENQRFVEYLNRGSHILQSILDEPDPVVKYDRPTYQQFVELLSLGNKALTPSWAQRAFHDLDFFFETRDEFRQFHSLGATVLLKSIEASIPEKPESISLTTLIEFEKQLSYRG